MADTLKGFHKASHKTSQPCIQIIGVPIDLGASRRGTDGGPSALRVAGLGGQLAALGHQLAVEKDIAVPAMESCGQDQSTMRYKSEILQVCTELAEQTRSALARGDMPLIIGGDHSIAHGSVAGVACHYQEQKQSIGLLWFDAHGDINTPDISPSGNIHGMPLAHLLGYGDTDLANILDFSPKVRPENVVLIGIRDIDAGERELIQRSGITVYTMRDIDERGMAAISREAMQIVCNGTAGFHVSFDVDGCDPSVIPGSGTLVPGGVSFREAHLLLEYCADTQKMLSMEVVELNPFLDQGNISAERTISLIKSAFGKRVL